MDMPEMARKLGCRDDPAALFCTIPCSKLPCEVLMPKNCFMDKDRPCDLTCKAAFEVDDPVDNIDCYLIWLAYHFGEGFYEIKRALEGGPGGPPSQAGAGGPGNPPGAGPKKPKGFPNN